MWKKCKHYPQPQPGNITQTGGNGLGGAGAVFNEGTPPISGGTF
jgi:hypothetical protein